MPQGTNHICKGCWGGCGETEVNDWKRQARGGAEGGKQPLGKQAPAKTGTTARLKGWGCHDWQMDPEVGERTGKGGAGVVGAPSVSSWARPPPGTSCRKSLRRQKSRRGRVLLRHCSTAFRKHWRAGERCRYFCRPGAGSLEELQGSPSSPSPTSPCQCPAPSTISHSF